MRYAILWTVGLLVVGAVTPVVAQDRRRVGREPKSSGAASVSVLPIGSARISSSTTTRCGGCALPSGPMPPAGERWNDVRPPSGAPSRGQLRPGVAAVPDSVARLTDDLVEIRVRYAQSFREEQAELSKYLDPVQRARVTLLRERLTNRAREFHGPLRPRFRGRMDQ